MELQQYSLLRYILNIFNWLWQFIWSFFGAVPDDAPTPDSNSSSSVDGSSPSVDAQSSSIVSTNFEDVNLIVQSFKDASLLPPPPHFEGSLKQASCLAEEMNRLILLYIHDDVSSNFASDVISNSLFSEFVGVHFVFFMLHRNSKKGTKFARSFKMEAPCLLLLKPDVALKKMNVLLKIDSNRSLDFILSSLVNVCEEMDFESPQSQQTEHSSEMQAQDEAFIQAMKKDQAIAKAKKEKELAEKAEKEAAIAREIEKESKIASLEKERALLRKKFSSPLDNDVPSAFMKFRFPNGATLSRAFPLDGKISLCYEFVHSRTTEDDGWQPHPSSLLGSYELSTIYPRKVLSPSSLISDASLNNQTISVVEYPPSEED